MHYIEKIPTAFIQTLEDYLIRMKSKKQVKIHDPKKSAEIIFSSMIGFAFLHAYSSSDQYEKEVEIFISHAIDQFINGLIWIRIKKHLNTLLNCSDSLYSGFFLF